MNSFKPSKYQQAINDFIEKGAGCAIIEAVAGSGKTTTIVNALKLIPTTQKVAFLAFNKSIAVELKARVPSHVDAMTLNSMGHRAWSKYAGRFCKIDGNKTRGILQSMFEYADEDTKRCAHDYRSEIGRLVGLAKANGIAPTGCGRRGLMSDTPDVWRDMIESHDMDIVDADIAPVVSIAREALLRSAQIKDVIDFDDQLYMTVLYDVPMFRFDWLFVDEAQDLSPIQHALLRKALRHGGRLVAVGDPHQAIYGFRGADSDSMNRLQQAFDCQRLPLSMSYRCPQNVVHYAQRLVSEIEASTTAEDGAVMCWPLYTAKDFNVKDLVICRNTKPLIGMAYSLIRHRVPVRVLGREIGNGLVSLINKIDRRKKGRKIHGENGLIDRLDSWLAKEVTRAVAKGDEAKAEASEDKYNTIMEFVNDSGVERTDDLIAEIERLFSDEAGDKLTLSTIHKAKGLEADRVFLLEPELLPSRRARKDWQRQQEANLEYVAVTRAKHTLVLIRQNDMVAPQVAAAVREVA